METPFIPERNGADRLKALCEEAEEGARKRERLDDIRGLSNVVQALENLATQCDGQPRFERLQASALRELSALRKALLETIHRR